ncbi:1,4-alpha-glucan branching protein GlgB [Roseococcus sp. SDR]|uniref:1,4-alpha-glucan branching protein GlgB n=1 Tax=Roseococcus sp. SDR TaxID=2835532 RepID=UPI001BCC6A34|nr:1,4-alpha-glucan branching protein GlgB [Roseococcus sp. SDR]MBS7789698.1 1,4-alpha-glucan branching protein GlgB [Roseococcus sp. SDR]MBV1845012.1 1,4-alpha-glucan branching protein GlgB [Roseococcus sp. SDR]
MHASEGDVAALLAGRHADPFAVLGPHGAPGGLILRVLRPGAASVEASFTGLVQRLEARDPNGFFEGFIPGVRLGEAYRLRITEGGTTSEVLDPYAFGPGLGPLDDHLLIEGTHHRLHDRLGAHLVTQEGVAGVRFAVWAPHARRVSVVGEFNRWDGRWHPMRRRVDSGIWEIFLPGITEGTAYKYELLGPDGALLPLKADPFGFAAELRPANASVVARIDDFTWTDEAWMEARAKRDPRAAPMAIYEVHAPSWKRHPDGRFWNWDELAADLIPYVADLGFTHIELMPVMEHPFDGSWGYQPIGMHAVTARMGHPSGLARFINAAHMAGIGVILDWVPAHFPDDAHGLARFDGTCLYEHPDPRRGWHPDWQTAIYDYGRKEVQAFLASNALFWLERYHADGLRVDAVSSMIHLDYSRGPGEWAPNEDGGNDNRDAVGFLRRTNAMLAREAPGAMIIAEEATNWSGVSAPVSKGGLGFAFKWNMGWMNDTLRYVAKDPLFRVHHHQLMNFGLMYAFNERFILPLSHDEVVHGKGTIGGRMPGDTWQKLAGLRAYLGFMWGHPGKKLLFMGQEFAPWAEWSEARELDWWLLQYAPHQGVQAFVRELNRLHREAPALHAADARPEGFCWIDANDAEHSLFTWLRFDGKGGPPVAVLCNFTPIPREGVLIGLPQAGGWLEVLNSDAAEFGGSGRGNLGRVEAVPVPAFGQPASARVFLPPLCTIHLAPEAWEMPKPTTVATTSGKTHAS